MMFVGCDVHKKTTRVVQYDDQTGEVGRSYPVPTADLAKHLCELDVPIRVAIETSNAGLFAAREALSCGLDVLMVDGFKASRLMATVSRNKTDKLDAYALAVLLAKGCLDHAQVWVASPQIHELRELVGARYSLVCDGTRNRNRIRKLLSRNGLDCPYTDLLGKGATHWLEDASAVLPPASAVALSVLRTTLQVNHLHIEQLTEALQQQAAHHPEIELLMTIPGVGPVLAATIFARIGDIGRFDSACKLCSYANLAPSTRQSGDRCHTGPLAKHGDRLLSWALIQAAGHFAQMKSNRDLPMLNKYWRVLCAHGPNPAKVSLARHLVRVIVAMLRDGTAFEAQRHAAAAA